MGEKCRICLGNKKTLLNIFNSKEKTSYAEMMCAIANVRIIRDDGLPDEICRGCRKKLEEAFELKATIERADVALNNNVNNKRITFNNINDIKMEVEIDLDCKPVIKTEKQMLEIFNDEVDEIQYSNTVIKKSPCTSNVCLKPVPVLEFLKTIKEELDDDIDNDYEPDLYGDKNSDEDNYSINKDDYSNDSDDDDYMPLLWRKKKNQKRNKSSPRKNCNKENITKRKYRPKEAFHKVSIKPIHIDNLKLVYEKGRKKSKLQESTICPHCGLITKSLKQHLLQHIGERSFKCDECDKGFFTNQSLLKHKQTSHCTIRQFKCDECVAAFPDKAALLSHKIMHSSEFKFSCTICSKPFKRRATMKRHELAHNSANKNIKCELCNMSFFTKYGLRHHLRIHTGERPFKCELCSQPYSYKHDFNRHCLKKHGVFLKRRKVTVMNEEVLQKERKVIRDLMLRMQGVIKDDKPINPFESEGPQAALAFQQVIKAIENSQIPSDFL